jgi:hypothetical protein
MLVEHMQTVADMDFLITSVRRFLRTAALARQIPSEGQPQLKLALKIFNSQWANLKAVRDALEHSDTATRFPVPAVAISTSVDGDGRFIFMWPGGNVDVGKLYEDTHSILKAILRILAQIEAT